MSSLLQENRSQKNIFEQWRKPVHQRLLDLISQADIPQKTLHEAARYCLKSPGKLLRSSLVFATTSSFGGNQAMAIDPAVALEMIHTYSLIHDDLPCIDDDDIRRGQATLHTVYGDAIAVLTGDFFLTYAFEVLSFSTIDDARRVRLIQVLSHHAGGFGMIGGQIFDLQRAGHDLSQKELRFMHENKTGALISAALQFGAILSDVSEETLGQLKHLGLTLGVAYQVLDDILEVTTASSLLGKSNASDLKNKKATAVSCLGLEKAQAWLEKLSNEILSQIASLPCYNNHLQAVVKAMLNRKY